MATKIWLGHALNTRQVDTITIANTWAQNDTMTITIDNIAFVVTIGTLVTTAQVATTIKQAFNGETLTDTSASCVPTITQGGAQTMGQFAEIVASVSGSVVSLTSRTDGVPFTVSVSESTAGSGTATLAAEATASTGKWHASDPDNWNTNGVPADNDTVVFDQGAIGPKYELNLACQPAEIRIPKSFTGAIGLSPVNEDSSSKKYAEYRGTALTTDDNSVTAPWYIGDGVGQGSGFSRFDAGAGRTNLFVYGSGARTFPGIPSICWKGTHASNEVNNYEGDLGIATFPGETAAVATLRTGNDKNLAKTVCGSGVTLTTIVQNGGSLETNSAATTITQNSGTATHKAGAITTLTVGGTWDQVSNGTITTLTVRSGGVFDKSKDARSLTITNCTLHKGAKLLDPGGTITFSNGIILAAGVRLSDVTIDVGVGRTVSVS
jgi:hypothetical protein